LEIEATPFLFVNLKSTIVESKRLNKVTETFYIVFLFIPSIILTFKLAVESLETTFKKARISIKDKRYFLCFIGNE